VAEIVPYVQKVFESLSENFLMERCVMGATQNQNESFNSLIWNRCSKTEFCSEDVVEIAVGMAVMTFNSGKKSLKSLLERLGLNCSSLTMNLLVSQDEYRVWLAEWKSNEHVCCRWI